MQQYLDVLRNIMQHGVDRKDRTGTGTRSLFAQQMRFDLNAGFPAVTTKRLAWKSVVSELLWFLEGNNDERRLAEIRYDKPRGELDGKNTIWTANLKASYWKPKAQFDGDLGRIYGVQWRKWRGNNSEFDQIKRVINSIKAEPWDRRHVVTAWNPGELDEMALPPCHMIFQFYVANERLSCHMNQRSADIGLGVPFNIASYGLLTHMIAQVCNLGVGELVLTLGDAHVYLDHFNAIREQLKRQPKPLSKLWLNSQVQDIDGFTMEDVKLLDYACHGPISMDMAV